jgi:hypothetical protein
MRIKELITRLVEEYGAIVRTQHHLQITCGKGFHNIWTGKEGLKLQLYGHRNVNRASPEAILKYLAAYQPEASDLATMQRLVSFLKRLEGREGVFVDAGWKDGKARAAMVRISKNGNMNIMVWNFESVSNMDAEIAAMRMAWETWGHPIIHSDSQQAVKEFGNGSVWLPRELNKEADMLANKRGEE